MYSYRLIRRKAAILATTTAKLREWDSAEHLKTDEDMALYLEVCLAEAGEDAAFIAKALGTIARAKGMTQLARETGLGRESLYKALFGDGNPSFATVFRRIRSSTGGISGAEALAQALELKLALIGIQCKPESQRLARVLLGYLKPRLNYGKRPCYQGTETAASILTGVL